MLELLTIASVVGLVFALVRFLEPRDRCRWCGVVLTADTGIKYLWRDFRPLGNACDACARKVMEGPR